MKIPFKHEIDEQGNILVNPKILIPNILNPYGTDVEKNPRVEYGNIHQVKGLTRDNTIVDLTITREEQHFFEGLRLAYDAYSRGREDCWTVASRMPNLSLGRIENRKEILELNK